MILRADRNWLPDEEVALDRGRWSARHAFTYSLLGELGLWVAEAVNEVDGTQLGRGEVVIYPHRNHVWVLNSSTFCFDVMPGNGGRETEEDKARRRAAIDDLLCAKAATFFERESWIDCARAPTFDTEIRPLSSTGTTYHMIEDRNYVPLVGWGRRDFAE